MSLASNNDLARLVKANDKVNKSFFFFFSFGPFLLLKRGKNNRLCQHESVPASVKCSSIFVLEISLCILLPTIGLIIYCVQAIYTMQIDQTTHDRYYIVLTFFSKIFQ